MTAPRHAWPAIVVLNAMLGVGAALYAAVAVPVSMAVLPPLWQEYAVGLDYGGPVDLD